MLGDVVTVVAAVAGAVLGMFGAMFSVFQFAWNKKEKERDRLLTEKEKERDRLEVEKEKERDRLEVEKLARRAFLQDRIFSPSLTYEDKKPFYDEYVKLDYNGPVIEYWSKNYGKSAVKGS